MDYGTRGIHDLICSKIQILNRVFFGIKGEKAPKSEHLFSIRQLNFEIHSIRLYFSMYFFAVFDVVMTVRESKYGEEIHRGSPRMERPW